MKVDKIFSVTLTNGDLEIRVGKALITFAHKGQDKFVLRTEEVQPLISMLQKGQEEMNVFYAETKNEN